MDKTTGVLLTILGIIVVVIGSSMLVIARRTKLMTALEFVINKGASKSTTQNVGERYDFGDYGFYSNNRVVQFSTGNKGTYDKEKIVFDNGTTVLLVDIFK